MSGKIELIGPDGKEISSLRLPVVTLPDNGDDLAAGSAVRLSVKNAGTTLVSGITLKPEGAGADNIELAVPDSEFGSPGEALKLSDVLHPGESAFFSARGCYRANETEDAVELSLLISSLSTGIG